MAEAARKQMDRAEDKQELIKAKLLEAFGEDIAKAFEGTLRF